MMNPINLQRINRVNAQNANTPKSEQAEKKADVADDQLELSDQTHLLQAMMDEGTTEVSRARLEAIRDAITKGEYTVDYDKISQLMLDQSI